jgi:hypothetical protein
MANHKYHSRSPEEFKNYFQNLHKNPKKKKWRNLLLFIDILLLMFVFYLVSKAINPASEITQKLSNRMNYNDLELYYTKSKTSNQNEVLYFLFIKNNSNNTIKFGDNAIVKYSMISENNEICFNKEIKLGSTNISPNNLQSITLSFPKLAENQLSDDCKNIYKTPAFPRTIYNINKKKNRMDSHLMIDFPDGISLDLYITDDSW